MAAVEVTISGVLYDKLNRTTQNVVIIGEASLTGLAPGGGPIIPPPVSPGVPTHPIMLPGMPGWGDPHPAHPIANPGWPISGPPPWGINLPPGIWPNPPEGIAPHPEHPIVIPPPAEGGPPLEVKVIWTASTGWAVVLIPTGPHVTPSKAG